MTAPLTTQLFLLLDVLLAFVCGFALGVERKIRYKAAGIRTHAVVSTGAALMLIIGKYGFPESTSDGARIAAQIVTGVGFLGAGLIMYRQDSLRGITTAAGIWVTAGVGMAAGAGLYVLAVGSTVLILLAQWLFHRPISLFRSRQFYVYKVRFSMTSDDGEENSRIKTFFGITCFSRINYYNSQDKLSALAEISTNKHLSDDQIKNFVQESNYIASIERIYQLDGKE